MAREHPGIGELDFALRSSWRRRAVRGIDQHEESISWEIRRTARGEHPAKTNLPAGWSSDESRVDSEGFACESLEPQKSSKRPQDQLPDSSIRDPRDRIAFKETAETAFKANSRSKFSPTCRRLIATICISDADTVCIGGKSIPFERYTESR